MKMAKQFKTELVKHLLEAKTKEGREKTAWGRLELAQEIERRWGLFLEAQLDPESHTE